MNSEPNPLDQRARDEARSADRREGDDRLDLDEIFDVLKIERRRYVLRYLHLADHDVTVGELAEALAERASGNGTYTHRDRKRMYVSLYQSHLPKLRQAGVVEWDDRGGDVRLTAVFGQFEPYLYGRSTPSIRWGRLYLGAGALGVGTALLTRLQVISVLPETALLGALLGVYGTLIALHLFVRMQG